MKGEPYPPTNIRLFIVIILVVLGAASILSLWSSIQ